MLYAAPEGGALGPGTPPPRAPAVAEGAACGGAVGGGSAIIFIFGRSSMGPTFVVSRGF